jgi:hypothetical protein
MNSISSAFHRPWLPGMLIGHGVHSHYNEFTMEEQSYAKHTKLVPLYHGVLFGIVALTLIGAIFNLVRCLQAGVGRRDAVLIATLSFAMFLVMYFSRIFPLKAQDRAIRAEENLRHFALSGKLLDKRLSVKQIVGLRFASDGEFVALAQRAADENMSPDAIKRAVKTWKIDTDRL